jgi:hypothetical protein
VGTWSADLAGRWRELTEEAVTGMAEWRQQHPRATLREIEGALDERLGRVRARMLEDAALASAATDISALPVGERPRCPRCGGPLEAHGQEKRDLTTMENHTLTLTRSYATCPSCNEGLFPP